MKKILFILLSALLLIGCQYEVKPGSASDAFQKAFALAVHEDIEGLEQYYSDGMIDLYEDEDIKRNKKDLAYEITGSGEFLGIEIKKEKIDGDIAEVFYTAFREDGTEEELTQTLLKEDKGWIITEIYTTQGF